MRNSVVYQTKDDIQNILATLKAGEHMIKHSENTK